MPLNFKNRPVRTIYGGVLNNPPLPLIGVARSLPLIGLTYYVYDWQLISFTVLQVWLNLSKPSWWRDMQQKLSALSPAPTGDHHPARATPLPQMVCTTFVIATGLSWFISSGDRLAPNIVTRERDHSMTLTRYSNFLKLFFLLFYLLNFFNWDSYFAARIKNPYRAVIPSEIPDLKQSNIYYKFVIYSKFSTLSQLCPGFRAR